MNCDNSNKLWIPKPSILVLTGVTKPEQIERYSYIPTDVYDSVAEIEVN